MKLPEHKTKIVCTIGPASDSVEIIEEMIRNGMSVARINFSHVTPETVRRSVASIREAAARTGSIVNILADLPGAKIRIGRLAKEPLDLRKGQKVTLTAGKEPDPASIPVDYERLPESVAPGGKIYINDGFVELRVDGISGKNVQCTVIMGGTLLSHKGLNLPGAELFMDPVTPRDLELVRLGLSEGLDTFGISFVEKAADIVRIREAAEAEGRPIFAIAKIERGKAVSNIDEILTVADGIMIARGDLGVETPLEQVPMLQKQLIQKANLLGKPVITATQMLESMKNNTRPTRAEVSDVANAILDGTDAIMLSEETAIGKFPVETVRMMASIAATAQSSRNRIAATGQEQLRWYLKTLAEQGKLTVPDVISRNAAVGAEVLKAHYILTPTETGGTSRRVSRFKPECWILAFSRYEHTCRWLAISYGVYPFLMDHRGGNWHRPILKFLRENALVQKGDRLIVSEGRFVNRPGGTDSLGILTVGMNTPEA